MDLASIAGRVKETKVRQLHYENKFGGEFPKFRIELPTNEPIISGFFLERQERKPVWIHLKYVKLPSYCVHCARVNHESKHCDGEKLKENNVYEKWITAEDKS